MTKKSSLAIILFGAFTIFSSCKKSSGDEPNHTVTAISPDAGPAGTSVVIQGTNFGTSTTAVQVNFNSMPASITSITNTEIMTTVPPGAGTGPVSVAVNGQAVSGPTFNYLWLGNSTSLTTGGEGNNDGPANTAQFRYPRGIAIDRDGNLYVADYINHKIRKVTPDGNVSTFAGSNLGAGSADGTGTDARFNEPSDIDIDSDGNLYVADEKNHKIRKITPARVVTTIAGPPPGTVTSGDNDGVGSVARFRNPTGIAVDAANNIYVTDWANHKIRKIVINGTTATVSTAAGTTFGFADGDKSIAKFNSPFDVDADAQGNLYISDQYNYRIRKITFSSGNTTVSTIAGTGALGYVDGGGDVAQFNYATGIAVDAQGNVYLCDQDNHRIRRITPSRLVTTLAGAEAGNADGLGSNARFRGPAGIAINAQGILYVSEYYNHKIRKIVLQ